MLVITNNVNGVKLKILETMWYDIVSLIKGLASFSYDKFPKHKIYELK